LIERDSYNHIKEKYFFKQFKKWKFMRMWKKTIKHQNRMKAQNSLEEKLFMLQDHFSVHLSKHRIFMIEMEKQRFVDLCHTGDTKTIEDFADAQEERVMYIKEEIQKFSDRCRANIRDCISKVLSELRTRIVSEIALDEERKKNNPIQSGSNNISMKKKQSSNTFEKLGFPEGMTYGHRSSLRKECSRFLRFAYLVDFLSLEALANIYTGSVRDMIERIKDLDVNCDMHEVMNADFADQNNATGPSRGSDPLFKVDLELRNETPIPKEEIHEELIEDFVLPPRGTSETQDFDLLSHL
jgi:dynein heavy chain